MCVCVGECWVSPLRYGDWQQIQLPVLSCQYTWSKCLSDGWAASEIHLSHTLTKGVWERLCPTVPLAFWNRQSDIHTHFTQWSAKCERKFAGFQPLFLALFSINCFGHFCCVWYYDCLPVETVWKCLLLSLYFNDYCFSPSLWWPVFHLECDH